MDLSIRVIALILLGSPFLAKRNSLHQGAHTYRLSKLLKNFFSPFVAAFSARRGNSDFEGLPGFRQEAEENFYLSPLAPEPLQNPSTPGCGGRT